MLAYRLAVIHTTKSIDYSICDVVKRVVDNVTQSLASQGIWKWGEITRQGSSQWGITRLLCILAVFVVHSIHS